LIGLPGIIQITKFITTDGYIPQFEGPLLDDRSLTPFQTNSPPRPATGLTIKPSIFDLEMPFRDLFTNLISGQRLRLTCQAASQFSAIDHKILSSNPGCFV
jgi:hypothetical protein